MFVNLLSKRKYMRQSKKSVALAVIASYSRCFVRMLPEVSLPAHFTALPYIVSILLRLFLSPSRRVRRSPPTACGWHTFALYCLELQWTIGTSSFHQKVISRQNFASRFL